MVTELTPLKSKIDSVAPEDFVVLSVTQPIDFWYGKITQKSNKHVLIRVTAFFDDNKWVTSSIDLNFNRFSIKLQTADDSQEWLQQLAEFKISYLPVFSTLLPTEERRP